MKIKSLRFQNLNSLRGEWCIDFTNAAYQDDGIFAITGPTASGKTTILDAIALALYGCTPRQKKLSKECNEIMSRQTGECYAEVEFETMSGSYRARWSHHRAHKKVTGQLSTAKHELAYTTTGQIIESKLSQTAKAVEKVTGLDFDRFTRSMMLAQGKFNKFLDATEDQRASILKEITGTGIYEDISKEAHERERAEGVKLTQLQQEMAASAPLAADERTALEQQYTADNAASAEASTVLAQLRAQIEQLVNRIGKEQEIIVVQARIAAIKQQQADTQEPRLQLKHALLAGDVENIYAQLTMRQQEQAQGAAAVQQARDALPAAVAAEQQARTQQQQATVATEAIKKEHSAFSVLAQKVRTVDEQLRALRQRDTELQTERALVRTQATERAQTLTDQRAQQAANALKLTQLHLWQKEHAGDAVLVTALILLEQRTKDYQRISNEHTNEQCALPPLQQQQQALDVQHAAHATEMQALQATTQDLATQQQQAEQQRAALLAGSTASAFRKAKNTEIRLRQQIHSLTDARDALSAGEACPLCGSEEHPFVTNAVPNDAVEALQASLKELDAGEERLTGINKKQAKNTEHGQRIQQAILAIETQRAGIREQCAQMEKNIHKLASAQADGAAQLNESLQACGYTSMPPVTEMPQVLDDVRQRQKLWLVGEQQHRELDKEQGVLEKSTQLEQRQLEQTNAESVAKEQACAAHTLTLNDRQAQRHQLCADTDIDVAEKTLTQRMQVAEEQLKGAVSGQQQCKEHVSAFQQQEQTSRAALQQTQKKVTESEQAFTAQCQQNQIADEAQYLAYAMHTDERNTLRTTIEAVDTDLRTQEDRRTLLDEQLTACASTSEQEKVETLAEAQQRLELQQQACTAREQAYTVLVEGVGKQRSQLENDDTRLARSAQAQKRIDKQASEHGRWARLSALIGSSDGRKFSRFAQGLTFEVMIEHANVQLQKMSDRYRLVNSVKNPLDLHIVDSYQEGTMRHVSNLSGGESFIVSLALALGLAQMSSKNVRVDSLFIDEGFGTLDNEMLEVALNTLTHLHQDGKLIGVISHIDALKDSIPTHIRVSRHAAGVSSIAGPGCSGGMLQVSTATKKESKKKA